MPLRIGRGSATCPRCGHEQSKLQQETLWSLDPGLVRMQKILRGAAVLATAGVGFALSRLMTGASLFWGLGLLGGLGWLLWYTAGCLTRRASFMDLRFLWPPLLLCVALGPLVLSLALGWIAGETQAREKVMPGLVWALPWLLPLAVSLVLPRRYARYRAECLAGGEAQ
ncbi:MAG: hypothetical protein R3F33_07205 [Planctomycetota bacterium]